MKSLNTIITFSSYVKRLYFLPNFLFSTVKSFHRLSTKLQKKKNNLYHVNNLKSNVQITLK